MQTSLNNIIEPEEFTAALSEAFDRGQDLIFVPSGVSMLPMLDGKTDKVTFSPKPDRLRKYDVVFYQRPGSGQLVLHRIVKLCNGGSYVMSGDNQYYYEFGITDDDILAIVTAFTHKGKERKPTDIGYRFYIRRMMFKKRLRMFAYKIYRRLKRSK